jgi:hypothetical protein
VLVTSPRLIVGAAALALCASLVPVAEAVRTPSLAVAVLSSPTLAPVGVPAGLTATWVVSSLREQGIAAYLAAADQVADADVIVNPYGEALPDSPALATALDHGAGWVNVAGVPFLRPNGAADSTRPARYGVYAPPTPSTWFTGSEATELGSTLLPSVPVSSSDHNGWTLHARTPADERPLAHYEDATGLDGGPAITLILRPNRIVAAGYLGDGSPLNPTRDSARPLLLQMVRLAAGPSAEIADLTVRTVGDRLVVKADGEGRLTGTGAFVTPRRWSPDHPEIEGATVRLYSHGKLADLRQIVVNPAVVRTHGSQVYVNDAPFTVKGVALGYSFPPGMAPLTQASTERNDLRRMRDTGINALRSYGYLSDWSINAAARVGLFVMDALPIGSLTADTVTRTLPWASFVGARGAATANLLMYSLGNETQNAGPGDPATVASQLQELDQAIKSTDGGIHPITYAASEDEPWLLGALPFLDIYGYNTYGATYPFAYDAAGFTVSLKIVRQIIGPDRPLVVTEWGVNATPTGQAALVSGADVSAAETPARLAIAQKWQALQQENTVGGYYFQWSDALKTGFPLPVPLYEQTLGAFEYPAGSGYRPANEEDFWGLNDVYRKPRSTLTALKSAYQS